jgi:hypothetical protein
MSDDRPPFYSPNRTPTPRQPTPGEEVWRLRKGDYVQGASSGAIRKRAGWDVLVRENGEPLFSRRCADERGARYVAESFRRDLIRTGWTEENASTSS